MGARNEVEANSEGGCLRACGMMGGWGRRGRRDGTAERMAADGGKWLSKHNFGEFVSDDPVVGLLSNWEGDCRSERMR